MLKLLSLGLIATLLVLETHPGLAASIQRDRSGKIDLIVIEGELQAGDEAKFINEAVTLGQAVVAFHSPGGDLRAGIEIGKAIRLKGFSTVVADSASCASACALAWLGGTTRLMGDRARVGFHAAYTEVGSQKHTTSIGNALVGAYLNQLGLPERAVIYITRASPDQITWLSVKDAQSVGISVVSLEPSTPSRTVAPAPEVVQPRITKMLLGSHIGDATVLSITDLNGDKAVALLRREPEDSFEYCNREFYGNQSAVSKCLQSEKRDWGSKVVTRRAFCSRSTIYTEFGNYSMVNIANEGSLSRTDWKDHKTDRIVGNCSACNTPQLIDTFEKLCPAWAARLFGNTRPY
jgi:hypothetical protein